MILSLYFIIHYSYYTFLILDAHEGTVVTLIVRGSTENIMDDIERAIDDGVNTYKCLTRNPKLVAGAGAIEIELARRLLAFSDTVPALEQYSIREFARAFEIIIKALADNAGQRVCFFFLS